MQTKYLTTDQSRFADLQQGVPGTGALNGARSIHLAGPVIFATDFHSVTSQAIGHAAFFCRMLKAPLHCLHVLPSSLEGSPQSFLVPAIMTEALRYIYTEQASAVSACICAIRYGSEISSAVSDYAREQGAKLIVLGVLKASLATHQESPQIATGIIHNAPCPVLTMAYALDDTQEC